MGGRLLGGVAALLAPAGTAAGLAGMALALAAPPAGAADITVLGCNEGNVGEVGVRELVGDVGDTLGVAVTVHTAAPFAAFGLDLSFPTHLLSYIDTQPGPLTTGWWLIHSFHVALGAVRVGGFNPTGAVPSGSTGTLAVVHFEVTAAGADSFSTGNYVDDLIGYVACDSLHAPTAIPAGAWGSVKALYR